MGQLAVGVEGLAGRVAAVVVLDMPDVFADDGHGVGAELDILDRTRTGGGKQGGCCGECGAEDGFSVHRILGYFCRTKDTHVRAKILYPMMQILSFFGQNW